MIGYSVVNQKGQVTIPANIRKELKIKSGERVVIMKSKDTITIKPAPDIFSLRGSVKPVKKPEDFKAMRKAFLEYLGTRKK